MKYIIGCNYWDSVHGTDMWRDYDPALIRRDLAALKGTGVRVLRVFPNWRDFQPVCRLGWWMGILGEYMDPKDQPLADSSGVDPKMLAHFHDFCRAAEENGMTLMVSVLTGWMSGRLFYPPALEGKNLLSDPDALMWENRFVRRFVQDLKDEPCILWWDLGNECNNMSRLTDNAQAYTWTAMIRDAIRAEDPTRPILSGMHGLAVEDREIWQMATQGELCDMMTTHPYPSKTIGGDKEPMNQLRPTLLPTLQTELYATVGGKPAMMQEQGTLCEILGNRQVAADFVRVNMLSGWANGSRGYLFWCGHDHCGLKQPPYSWSMVERELGLLDVHYKPKPVGDVMKSVGKRLDKLPELPAKRYDAVCVLTKDQAQQNIALACAALGKQAGLDIACYWCGQKLPESRLYFLPSIQSYNVFYRNTLDFLVEQVREKGATLFISAADGFVTSFEELTGLRSFGMRLRTEEQTGTFRLDGESIELPFTCEKEYLLQPLDAEVFATNAEGNPILARHRLGKGFVWFMGFPVEKMLWAQTGVLANAEQLPYYRLYAQAGAELLQEKPVRSGNPLVGVTVHAVSRQEGYAVAVNYDSREQQAKLILQENCVLEPLDGNVERIPACDACVYRYRFE